VSATTAALAPPGLRTGAGAWLSAFAVMVRWHLTSMRMWLALLGMVQTLLGVGYVLGVGLFFDEVPASAAAFVSTGAPVLNLLLLGMLLGPQLVADMKASGGYEFVRALPVPTTASAAAWYVVNVLGAVPAFVVTLLVARVRYPDVPFAVSPMVVPAVLLVVLAATMVGYALAYAIVDPRVTQLITQVLVFAVLGFAPIVFPPQQMPAWLVSVNDWLPPTHMASVVRDALTEGIVTADVGRSYLVLAVWALLAGAAAVRELGRRR
jgi:ABC-2 type transport system permease protein